MGVSTSSQARAVLSSGLNVAMVARRAMHRTIGDPRNRTLASEPSSTVLVKQGGRDSVTVSMPSFGFG